MSSLASASPSATHTSNTNETATSVPSAPNESKSDTGHVGGATARNTSALPNSIEYWYPYWHNGAWHNGPLTHFPTSEHIVIVLVNPKNYAVRGALHKMQQGIPTKRVTSEYLLEGIEKWCTEEKRSVMPNAFGSVIATEEEFVKYVWHHMRQNQRDTTDAVEAKRLQLGLTGAKGQLETHYAEFPDERKSDEELVAMFRKLDVWSAVVSSEQRRVASKKRYEKEERLIHEKFCGDRAAYNRWKALNEKVSLGRIRDVSPQLLVKFAQWIEENPDFLYPGSKDTSMLNAEHHVRDPLSYQYDTLRGFHNISLVNADVSKEHMLTTIKELMSSFTSARIEVTLEFDRSPLEYTMTDKYPLLKMHGCQRLISGEKHVILAVNNDKLVFEKTTIMIKRLPDRFHKQLKGHCEREGLFKELECHRVFAHTPGLITKATISGQIRSSPSDRENFKIELRLTSRANNTFSLEDIRHKKRLEFVRLEFVESLKKEAADKRTGARRNASRPSSTSSVGMAQNLLQLGQMYKEGLLTKEEFMKAKDTVM